MYFLNGFQFVPRPVWVFQWNDYLKRFETRAIDGCRASDQKVSCHITDVFNCAYALFVSGSAVSVLQRYE